MTTVLMCDLSCRTKNQRAALRRTSILVLGGSRRGLGMLGIVERELLADVCLIESPPSWPWRFYLFRLGLLLKEFWFRFATTFLANCPRSLFWFFPLPFLSSSWTVVLRCVSVFSAT